MFFSWALSVYSQDQIPAGTKPKYYRKEEIIYDQKRYRIHNNYVTLGGGFLTSSLREDVQKNIGFDFHFHIRRQYFQAGLLMSGVEFMSNNNLQGHLGYGIRRENSFANFALFGGITYYTGVKAFEDSINGVIPLYYQGVGAYLSAQAIKKITYDVGIGVELFGELSGTQKMAGIKFVLFFSGAYKGAKQKYNKYVRSENKEMQ